MHWVLFGCLTSWPFRAVPYAWYMEREDRLFDVYDRTDGKPRRRIEPEFDFWNRCGWNAANEVRNLLEAIYSCYSHTHRAQLRGRFRSDREGDHNGALFELLLFAALDPQTVKVNAGTPDFEFERRGRTYLLEAKVFEEHTTGDMHEQRVLDTIDTKLRSPDYFLSIDAEGILVQPPPDRAFIPQLRELLETRPENWDKNTLPTTEINLDDYSEDSYRLNVHLLSKRVDAPNHRLIGIQALDLNSPLTIEIAWCVKLGRELKLKAKKLKARDEPSYIAISVPSFPSVATIDVARRVLYGSSPETGASGLDCFWLKGRKQRNRHVQGVAVFGALLPQALDHHEMVGRMFMAPDAEEPPEPLARLPRVRLYGDTVSEQPGGKLGELVRGGLGVSA